ncbi:hypothetical protein Stsp02_48480 [Streptomyces sp. NBRC 14336]|uniref:hypothetical protein n=1 Tax=Streptomyces sp. NBRC 14336 TaxID=3030992 RepID=UPI0024A4A37D|nr:hypothetical protein [Streptomyces sp. NBRC 14336]WBO79329.1 hypothetical protein SBE_003024 [Streptomyces sp. SBE_14.2]GLW49187.1 hypothetical protein Stsp02_48480 [Streptomyces sp. NBRC 14336]
MHQPLRLALATATAVALTGGLLTFTAATAVWRGTSSGPSGSAMYNRAGSGVAGSPEADDNFGYAVSAEEYAAFGHTVRLRDVTHDGKTDVGVGGGAGTSVVLRAPSVTGGFTLPRFTGPFTD